jgi:hypothetical protein
MLLNTLDVSKLFDVNLPPDMCRLQILEAKKRLVQLVREQQKINQEINDLRELIRANANFLPDEERDVQLMFLEIFKSPANMTEAVRLSIFIASMYSKRITPLEAKSLAESVGFDFSEYSNPMASVHTILKRMKEANPPSIDYDEDTDTYWFGDVVIGAAGDLVNPKFFEEIYAEVVKALLEGTSEDVPTVVRNAMKSNIVKKVEAIRKKRVLD